MLGGTEVYPVIRVKVSSTEIVVGIFYETLSSVSHEVII
jgi:hypothetical protein|tara:strand:+ start:337 stop:453 length:117 start_codon:yes stop_codon:yes gene_type:complete